MKKFLFIFTTLSTLSNKVLIITHSFNNPLFIEWQDKCFKRFLKDPYTFVVFNDAANPTLESEINITCNRLKIPCIRVPQVIHELPYLPRFKGDDFNRPNIRHCNGLQFSMNKIGFFHPGPVFIIDSDMFLIRPISIIKEVEDYHVVAALRSGGKNAYFWAGFTILNMPTLPSPQMLNFNCGPFEGESLDSGGYTTLYMKTFPHLKLKNVDEIFSYSIFCPDRFGKYDPKEVNKPDAEKIPILKARGFNDLEIQFILQRPDTIQFLFNNSVLHFRAGSNYDNQSNDYMKNKMTMINNFLNTVINH